MKRTFLTAGIVLTLTLGNAWAEGPYTPSLLGDIYAPVNNGIPTANDQTDGGAAGGTQIYRSVGQLLGETFTSNSDVDSYQFSGNDNAWVDSSGFFSLISLSGSNANTLNVYNASNPALKFDVFGGSGFGSAITGDGSPTFPYFPAANTPLPDGSTFGFSLASFADWDSDPTKGDNAGLDHMFTYDLGVLAGQKANFLFSDGTDPVEYTFRHPYLIAFEDLPLGTHVFDRLGDEDFNDNIYLVDGASPIGRTAVPEPISTVLFLTGGAAMAGNLIRRRMQAKV